jgi:tetratricopeptide (TPR) repeat protein/O-antigen ligase
MRSRLSLVCDGLLEAGWLTATVVAALFFNVYSNRSFEPDRFVLLRGLALLMVVAWLVRLIEDRSWRGWSVRAWLRQPAAPALVLTGLLVITTATALLPGFSFWGSYQRLHGSYSALAYLVIFFLAADGLRVAARRRRLITTLILTSVPVALYGIVQALGWDPVVWSSSFGVRVSSTQGNPIFAGAFLLMIVPLTLARAVEAWTDRPRRPPPVPSVHGGGGGGAGVYGLVLAAQVACLALTQSQGPLLGLAAAVSSFVLLLAAARGPRWLMVLLAGLAVVGVLLLVLLVLPAGPLSGLRQLPVLSRLSVETGTGAERVLTWRGVLAMVGATPLRTLLGYGPDGMITAFPRFVPPELPPLSYRPDVGYDRAHNEILDQWATLGLAGVVTYLVVIGTVFVYGLRHLVTLSSSPGHLVTLSSVLGALVGWLATPGHEFVGLTTTGGLLAGLGACLVAWRQPTPAARPELKTALLWAGVLAALAGHLVEVQSGIGVAATRLTFWLLAALVAAGDGQTSHLTPPPPSLQGKGENQGRRRRGGRDSRPGHRPAAGPPPPIPPVDGGEKGGAAGGALLVALVLATLTFAMLAPQADRERLWLGLGGLVLTTWVLSGLVIVTASSPPSPPVNGGGKAGAGALASYAPLVLGWFLPFFLVNLTSLVLGLDGAFVFTVYAAYLLATMILLGLVLEVRNPQSAIESRTTWNFRRVSPQRALVYTALAVAGLAVVVATDLTVVWADIALKQGLGLANAGRIDQAVPYFEQAARLAPQQDAYTIYLAGGYAERARTLPSPAERDAWLQKAQQALERGRTVNPYNPDLPAKLGLLYRVWGDLTPDVNARREHYERAAAYYSQAAVLGPQVAQIQREWGMVEQALDHLDLAIVHLERAAQLGPRVLDAHLLLGQAYLDRGDFDRAAEAYRQAVKLDRDGVLKAKESEARAAPQSWTAHRNLALMYWVVGRHEEAMAEAQTALQMAPADDRSGLERLIAALQKQR